MSQNLSKVDIIQAILTNQSLTDNEKKLLVDEFIDEIKKEYPALKYHATKSDVTELELSLTKEIEIIRKEIKELDVKLSKDIKELDVRLTKEIKELELSLTKEIKELDVRLTKEMATNKTDTIKWVAGMLFVQVLALSGVLFGAFKLFLSHS